MIVFFFLGGGSAVSGDYAGKVNKEHYPCACTSQYPIRMVDHDESAISAGGHDHRMIIRCSDILKNPSFYIFSFSLQAEKRKTGGGTNEGKSRTYPDDTPMPGNDKPP